jgi:hypothetical protein
MRNKLIQRDERTVAVENASYRFAYYTLSFGLLLIVGYRAAVLRDSNFDLLALVILGGLVAALYQALHRVLSPRWVVMLTMTVLGGAAIAAIAAIAQGLLAR